MLFLFKRRPNLGTVSVLHRPITAAPLSRPVKLALVAEILAAYVRARRLMPRHDIRDVVAATRAASPAPAGGAQPDSPETALVAARLGYAVMKTLRALPTDSRCLVQALVLTRLLAARGISGRLVIGARSRPQFAAHAWVEHAGEPVLPAAEYAQSRLIEL